MNRPGPVGFTLLATFGLVATIEFRTVLSMVGIETTAELYFPIAFLVLAIALAALYFLPGQQGDSDEEPPAEA